MTTNYSDCESYFTQALENPKGIRVALDTNGAAIHFMQKMNTYRSNQRKALAKVYGADHPLHNKTPWDDLVLRVDKEDPTKVRIEPARLNVKGVETL